MIIAISSLGAGETAEVNERFGRTTYFIFYDTDKKTYKTVDNSINAGAAQGAGIQSAQLIVDNNASVLISGNVGPKAFDVLSSAGVKMYQTIKNATVAKAIEAYLQNRLTLITGQTKNGRW